VEDPASFIIGFEFEEGVAKDSMEELLLLFFDAVGIARTVRGFLVSMEDFRVRELRWIQL